MRLLAYASLLTLMLFSLPLASQEATEDPYCRAVANGNERGEELARACEFVWALPQKLPDVICEETTKRFDTPVGNTLVLMETISATVTHDKSGQQYADVSINGQPFKGSVADLIGAWSTGEFAGDLDVLFEPQSVTKFKFVKETTLREIPALLFEFKIARENNKTWSLVGGKRKVYPGLKGRLWLELTSSRILRLEVETADVPDGVAMKKLTKKINYDDLMLGDGTKFVLPVEVEATYCKYSVEKCAVNLVSFNDCHKFAAKARVVE